MKRLGAVLAFVRENPRVMSMLAGVAFVQLALVGAAVALVTSGRPALGLVVPTVVLVGLVFVAWLAGMRAIAAAAPALTPIACTCDNCRDVASGRSTSERVEALRAGYGNGPVGGAQAAFPCVVCGSDFNVHFITDEPACRLCIIAALRMFRGSELARRLARPADDESAAPREARCFHCRARGPVLHQFAVAPNVSAWACADCRSSSGAAPTKEDNHPGA